MFSKQNKVNDIEDDANRPSQFRSIVLSAVVFSPLVHLNTTLHHHHFLMSILYAAGV